MSQASVPQETDPKPSEPEPSASGLRWDRLGFFASSLCAVHCVCLPLLLLVMPFLAGTWLVDRELEQGFVAVSILLATACTVGGCRTHGKWWLMGLLGAGAVALISAHATAPPVCCSEHLSWPHAIGAALGGTLLAATHFLNLRMHRMPTAMPIDQCCGDLGCSGNRT